LAVAVRVSGAPVVPDAGDTETQVADDAADHWGWFVVTETDVVPPFGGAAQALDETDTVAGGGAAAWVMVMVAFAVPAVMVTVAVRGEVAVLAAVVSTVDVPDVPDAGDVETQVADDTADHWGWFVVTATDELPPPAGAAQAVDETHTVAGGSAPAWVIVMVLSAVPAATVTSPVRENGVALGVAVSVREAPVSPELGETDSQPVQETAIHFGSFVVIEITELPPAAATDHAVADTDSVGSACVTVIVAVAVPAVTVTVAARGRPVSFLPAKSRMLVPEAPDAGDNDSQFADVIADHWL
jgi:hypothetical protein